MSKPTTEYYNAIRSPIRREIVQILSREESIGVLDLRRRLNISTGTLYHHLDILRPYLARTPDRKYILNERGEVLVSLVVSTDDKLKIYEERKTESYGGISNIMTLRPLSEGVGNGALSAIVIAPVVAALYIIFSTALRVRPQLLFLTETRTQVFDAALQAGLNLGLLVVYYLIVGLIISRRIDQETKTGLAILISSIPTLIYFLFLWVAQPIILASQEMLLTSRILFIGTHVWQLLAYAAAVSFTKGIAIEKTLTASIALSYISLLAIQFLTRAPVFPF